MYSYLSDGISGVKHGSRARARCSLTGRLPTLTRAAVMCPHCENRQRTGFLIGQGWICCPRWMRRCPLRWRSADEVQSAAHAQATSMVRVSWVVEGDVWCATVLDTVAAYHPAMGCALLKVARARQPILRWTVLAGASETAPGLIPTCMYLLLLIVCSDRGRVFIRTPTIMSSVYESGCAGGPGRGGSRKGT